MKYQSNIPVERSGKPSQSRLSVVWVDVWPVHAVFHLDWLVDELAGRPR